MDSTNYQTSTSKPLIEALNRLRDLGLHDLDLPRVALVGIKNAKVDIVTALLGFKGDNARRSCTFEYRLSRTTSPWSCRISVRGGEVPLQRVTTRVICNGLTNKNELPIMMKRAQIAALNPTDDFERITSMSEEEMDRYLATNFSLSSNTVCLELNDADLTDLTFIELPDLDFSFEHETRKFLENIVLSQLQGKCLIVAAVPLNEDIFSKRALYLAKHVDPDGARTIGVLTHLSQSTPKCPDPLLPLGYYYVAAHTGENSNPKGKQKPTLEGEKMIARALVSSPRGPERLESALSCLLSELIREMMPLLRVDISHSLHQCKQDIASLPTAVTEHAAHMLFMLTRLNDDISDIIHGRQLSALLKDIQDIYADFGRTIKKNAPNFVPVLRSTPITQDIVNRLAGNEASGEGILTTPLFYLDDMRKHIAVYRTRDILNDIPHQARKALITAFQNSWPTYVSECLERIVESFVKIMIECIQRVCQNYELLAENLRSLLGELICHHLSVCTEYLEAILEIELTPHTQHQDQLKSCSEKWLSTYRDVRKGQKRTERGSNNVSSDKQTTSPPGHLDQQDEVKHSTTKSSVSDNEPALLGGNKPSHIGKRKGLRGCQIGPNAKSDSPRVPRAPASERSDVLNIPDQESTTFFGSSSKPSRSAGSSVQATSQWCASKPSATGEGASELEGESPFRVVDNADSLSDASSRICSEPILQSPFPSKVVLDDESLKKPKASDESVTNSSTNNVERSNSQTTSSSSKAVNNNDLFASKRGPPSDNAGFTLSPKDERERDYDIALAALSRLGFTDLTKADLERTSTVDEYQDELKLMADVRAYFQIASTRVIDYIPALINLKFVRAVGSHVLPFFMEKMCLGKPTADTICATYFTENAETNAKRVGLADLQTRLERAQLELLKFGL